MTLSDVILTANRNLRRNKLRTFLTITSIIIGAFTLTISLSLGEGIKAYINSQIGTYKDTNLYRVERDTNQSFSQAFNSPSPEEYNPEAKKSVRNVGELVLTKAEIDSVKNIQSVANVYYPYVVNVEYLITSDAKKYTAPADMIIPEIQKTVIAGSIPSSDSESDVLISEKYLKVLSFSSAESAINKDIELAFKDVNGTIFTEKFKIAGVITPSIFDQAINFTSKTSEALSKKQLGLAAQNFNYLYASKKANVTDLEFKKEFEQVKLKASSMKDLVSTINSVIVFMQYGIAAFSLISITTAVIGVTNTLFMAVLERTKEIGLYRALGAKKKTIFQLFSFEALLIGFWGSLFGVAIANVAGKIGNAVASKNILKDIEGFQLLSTSLKLNLTIIGLIVIITFITGILPAIKAMRLDPIEALKYE